MAPTVQHDPVRVAVVGVGDISDVYLNAIQRSPMLALVSVAARSDASASRAAAARGVRADSVAGILSDDAVELVVDLAPGAAHDGLNTRIIQAGKHLYSEKPFALSGKRAADLAEQAERQGVRIGGAPDTFFGAAHQAVRQLLDAGAIGAPTIGTAFVGFPGVESFHPNPAPFYRAGAEMPFDIGPYHILQWVNLLGPVRAVFASASAGAATRVVRRGPSAGTAFAVDIPTSFCTVLAFERTSVSLILSLDILHHHPRPIELFGTDGVLFLSDPNFFGGEPALFKPDGGLCPIDLSGHAFGETNQLAHDGSAVANYRGAGLVDMALAIRSGGAHRTSPELVVHVAEVAEAIVRSADERRSIAIVSTCERPAPLGQHATDAALREFMPSPVGSRQRRRCPASSDLDQTNKISVAILQLVGRS